MEDILYKNSATDIRIKEMVTKTSVNSTDVSLSNVKKVILRNINGGELETIEVLLPVENLEQTNIETLALQQVTLVLSDMNIILYPFGDFWLKPLVTFELNNKYKTYYAVHDYEDGGLYTTNTILYLCYVEADEPIFWEEFEPSPEHAFMKTKVDTRVS